MFSEASICAGCSHKLAANGQLYTEGVGGIPKEKHDRVVKRFLAWYGNYPIRGEGVVGREMRKCLVFYCRVSLTTPQGIPKNHIQVNSVSC